MGWGPTQKLAKSQHTKMCKLAGPQQREIGSPIPTNNASWRGPNIEAGEKSAYKNVQVGGAPT
ncbi:hypothetical protein A4S03_13930 [Staphylococcus aureus]|nr:hypothetical protein TM60_004935 [Staphylococcus aureus]MDH2988315.1 hypothetical protein [Staphylococcus aureus]MDH2991215.1 hypothetical protein [Staphylococcus aureus]OAP73902.1 hypothetical protein A4U71_07290 [Staphylococcus aureus]OAP79509.1 hypothetical protein A4U86_12370 [Staphylococcus aureus]